MLKKVSCGWRSAGKELGKWGRESGVGFRIPGLAAFMAGFTSGVSSGNVCDQGDLTLILEFRNLRHFLFAIRH